MSLYFMENNLYVYVKYVDWNLLKFKIFRLRYMVYVKFKYSIEILLK